MCARRASCATCWKSAWVQPPASFRTDLQSWPAPHILLQSASIITLHVVLVWFGLQARRTRGGSSTLLVQRPTKATNYMRTKLAVIANQLNEDVVAVITSDHDNVDTRCCCTCWLAQVIWCIDGTQGDAHSIASSVLAVAVVTVRSQGPQSLSQQILIIFIPFVMCSIASAFRRRSPTSNCLNHSQRRGNHRRKDSPL